MTKMNSDKVRTTFFDFFKSKDHKIVPSALMVNKNDPTLMFTNAGMNQFKDIFLGNKPVKYPRIANSQKCLRVSGKHNDLEEVGHDTYHHTMFEMLGNWSFGDYFKKEAIEWAWELLTKVFKINKDDFYVTVFGGDESDGLPSDDEAFEHWKKILPEDRILYGTKKDNFWEMGNTGPCGPCSEIHIDLRSQDDKAKTNGRDLVNKDHPLVIEIWNLVFIEFNRSGSGKLNPLPNKHIDTGMGFERLCMVLQGVKSNYDIDLFQNIIAEISIISGKKYNTDNKTDVAMRVVADHLRAVAFSIADGQLPSNTGAGYVIRRILRRAVRYSYTYLDLDEPFLQELVNVLVEQMGKFYPELITQKDLIKKVITEEELSFLRTLSQGIKKFDQYISSHKDQKLIDGIFAFELFDTYGFPVDLTQLMAKEKGRHVDMEGFIKGMESQKNRSRDDAAIDVTDWNIIREKDEEDFIGYDTLETELYITRYRKVKTKGKELYHLVFNVTPFYPESGGQVGDTGYIESNGEKISIINTLKENDLAIHIANKMPSDPHSKFKAVVNKEKRLSTANNHSATHLLHEALREILGEHVEQKGSLVDADHLRFDFSHYQKVSDEELANIEARVNQKIRNNYSKEETRSINIDEALEKGALAFFGDKYDDNVRMIKFGDSLELCGGTHVNATGQIGLFKIISEGAIAAGIRRIEAITGKKSEEYVNKQSETIKKLRHLLKNQVDVIKGVKTIIEENDHYKKKINELTREKADKLCNELIDKAKSINDINFIAKKVNIDNAGIKDLAFALNRSMDNLFLVLANEDGEKVTLTIMISEELIKGKGLDAAKIIKDLAREIKGGGGGQPHYATAGGSYPGGIEKALEKAKSYIA